MDESYLWGPSEKARRMVYKKICPELQLEKYAYDQNEWRYAAVEKKELETDIFDKYWGKGNFLDSDWYKFQKAVEDHKDLSLSKFRPLFEQAGYAVHVNKLARIGNILRSINGRVLTEDPGRGRRSLSGVRKWRCEASIPT